MTVSTPSSSGGSIVFVKLQPPKGEPVLLWQGCRHLIHPEWLVGSLAIDKGGDPYLFVGDRNVFSIRKGDGPVFGGLIVYDFWIPVTLAAVKVRLPQVVNSPLAMICR